jgi:hypothetical protein
MSAWRRNIIGCILIVIMVFIFNPMAAAFVLQGQHILELMTEKLGQAQSLFISQKVVFYNIGEQPAAVEESEADTLSADDSQPSISEQDDTSPQLEEVELAPDKIEMEETLRYLFSNGFRSEIMTEDNHLIHVFAYGQAFTVIGGAAQLNPETRFDLYKDVLLFRSRPELASRLSLLNVDVSLSSLARFEGQIAFSIGAEDADEPVAQLLVDKESFRPLRWIIANGEAGYGAAHLEVRYLDWSQLDDSFWYPMRIEFFQNDSLVRSIQVQRYEVNPSFSPELFDINALRSNYPTAAPALSGSSESEGVSEVQKTIDEFRKMFE